MSGKKSVKKGPPAYGGSVRSSQAVANVKPTVQMDKVTHSDGRVEHNATVPVPEQFNPKNRSHAPYTAAQRGRWKPGEEGKTMASGPRTTLFVDKPRESAMPKQQSTMKPPKPRFIAQKSRNIGKADPFQEQFKKETEKMHRRVQGAASGKRAAARARVAAFGKGGEAYLPRPKTEWATPRETMSRMSYGARSASKKRKIFERHKMGIKDLGTVTMSADKKKSMRVMSIDEYFTMMKAEGDAPPTSGGGAGPEAGPAKKFARKMKPISEEEAMRNLKTGDNRKEGPIFNNYDKALVAKLFAIKALVTGYGRVSGGGALRAANRGPLMLDVDDDSDIEKGMRWSHKKPGHASTSHGKYHIGAHTDESGKTHHVVTYTHKESGRTFQKKFSSHREALGAATEHHLKNRPPPKKRQPKKAKPPEQKQLTARAGAPAHCPPCP